MSLFDTFKPLSFAGIKIPYKSYRVKGAYRKHVHEFPHSPGGAPEKLGRSLYEVTVTVNFDGSINTPTYKQLLTDLGVLRGLWEDGVTDALFIPHIGAFKAFADDWTEDVHNTDRSGVMTEIKFCEDQASAYLVLASLIVDSTTLKDAANNFQVKSEPFQQDLFAAINDLAIQISAITDQSNLYGALLAAKIDGLTAMIQHVHGQVKDLALPQNWELREALQRLFLEAIAIKNDIAQKGDLLRTFTVPLPMSVGQVAAAVYGDFSRGGEIMQLNVLPDPLRIEAGTAVRYYQAA